MSNNKEIKSIYVVCATNSDAPEDDLKISDLTILQRSPAQLTYRTIIPLNQTPKPFVGKDSKESDELFIQSTVREVVAGPIISDTSEFYQFVLDYIGDPNKLPRDQIDGFTRIPDKLEKTFYAYLTKKDAQKQADELNKRQNDSYEHVNPLLKDYMPKQRIVVADLILSLSVYSNQVISEIMKDPKAKETFMKNVKDFHPNMQG